MHTHPRPPGLRGTMKDAKSSQRPAAATTSITTQREYGGTCMGYAQDQQEVVATFGLRHAVFRVNNFLLILSSASAAASWRCRSRSVRLRCWAMAACGIEAVTAA